MFVCGFLLLYHQETIEIILFSIVKEINTEQLFINKNIKDYIKYIPEIY